MTDQTRSSQEEQRALTREEQALADQSRPPGIGQLSDKDLSDLIGLLRVRRNRARDIAARQGREARGKAGPKGSAPAGGNEGTRSKSDFLSAALDRATAERERRDAAGPEGTDQQDLARHAMAMKQSEQDDASGEEGGAVHPDDPNADQGKKALAATERNTAPSGALDHAGALPARERSRTRQ